MRRTKDITKQCKYKNCKYRHLPYKRFCKKHWDISTAQYLDPKRQEIAQKRREYYATHANEIPADERDLEEIKAKLAQPFVPVPSYFNSLRDEKPTLIQRIKAFIFIDP